MSVVERESSLTALRWETLMNQRAAYATTLWTRIAAFSFVSSILITASFFDNVTTTQRVLLAILGIVLAIVFTLINFRHDAYFSAVESGIKSAEDNLKELVFLSKIRFGWHQKVPIRVLVYVFPGAFLVVWIFQIISICI